MAYNSGKMDKKVKPPKKRSLKETPQPKKVKKY